MCETGFLGTFWNDFGIHYGERGRFKATFGVKKTPQLTGPRVAS